MGGRGGRFKAANSKEGRGHLTCQKVGGVDGNPGGRSLSNMLTVFN